MSLPYFSDLLTHLTPQLGDFGGRYYRDELTGKEYSINEVIKLFDAVAEINQDNPQIPTLYARIKQLDRDGKILVNQNESRLFQAATKIRQFFGNIWFNLFNPSKTEILNKWSERVPEAVNIVAPYHIDKLSEIELGHLVNSIYVLKGIKPVYFVSRGTKEGDLVKEFHENHPELKLVETKHALILINEHPLPDFDPRKFLLDFDTKYGSLENAMLNRPDNEMEEDKLLAYLLGFGPTWGAYATHGNLYYLRDNTRLSVYTDEHYRQLGQSLSPEASAEEQIELGKAHSLKAKRVDKRKLGFQLSPELDRQYFQCVADPVSLNTPYMKKAIALRDNLLQDLGIPFLKRKI